MRTVRIGSLFLLALSGGGLLGCGLLGWGGQDPPSFRDLESGRAMAAAAPTVFFSTRVKDRGSEVLGVRAEYVIHIAGTCPFAMGALEPSLRRELFEPSASAGAGGPGAYRFSLSPEDVAELNANGPTRWVTYRLTIEYRSAEGAEPERVHSEYLRTSPKMVETERKDRIVPINCP